MSNRFRLTSLLSDGDRQDKALKDYYKSWKDMNSKSKATFTAIDNSFFTSGILSELDSGPLKLYLYFSHAAKNEYGHSWHSIQTIADYFGTQTRTIDNWIRSLVDKNLIYRAPKGQKSYTTYLIPFSDTLISHPAPRKYATDNQELLNDLVEYIQGLESIYGKIVGVHHLFQWIIKDKKNTGSTQRLLIITQRTNGILIGHLHRLRKSNHLGVDELNIEEQCIFESPFVFNNKNIIGLALTPFPSLNSKTSIIDTIELVRELASIEEWKLRDRTELLYGLKDELLPSETSEEELEDKEDDEEEEEEEEHEQEKS